MQVSCHKHFVVLTLAALDSNVGWGNQQSPKDGPIWKDMLPRNLGININNTVPKKAALIGKQWGLRGKNMAKMKKKRDLYSWLHLLASDQLLVACQLLAEGSSLSSVLSQCPRFVGLIGPGEGDRRSMAWVPTAVRNLKVWHTKKPRKRKFYPFAG